MHLPYRVRPSSSRPGALAAQLTIERLYPAAPSYGRETGTTPGDPGVVGPPPPGGAGDGTPGADGPGRFAGGGTLPGSTYVYAPAAVALCTGVVTTTSTVAATCAPVTHVNYVPGPFGVGFVHATPPTVTLVTPVKPLPTMVMIVPPAVGPLVGVTP
jgi:hypothetical protein